MHYEYIFIEHLIYYSSSSNCLVSIYRFDAVSQKTVYNGHIFACQESLPCQSICFALNLLMFNCQFELCFFLYPRRLHCQWLSSRDFPTTLHRKPLQCYRPMTSLEREQIFGIDLFALLVSKFAYVDVYRINNSVTDNLNCW